MKSSWTRPRALSTPAGYLVSFAGLVAVIALRSALDPLLGDTLPLVTLYGSVAAAIWFSGLRAALLVAVLGYLACDYLFIEPRGQFDLRASVNLVGLAAYLFTCSLIIAFGEALRLAETRADASREVLRVTLRSIGDAVVTTDVEGKVTYLNTVAESLTGFGHEDAVGRPLDTVFRIVDEATRQPVESPAERAVREGKVVGLANHTVLVRKDGTECAIDDSAAPIRDDHGNVSGCVLIFRDVTLRRRIAQERRDELFAARRLASIVESSEVAIVGKGLDGIVRSWNAAAERLFGYRADEVIGRHISLVIPPERIAEEDEIIRTLKAGRGIEHFETERIRADGTRVLVSLTVSPIKDDDGNVIGASKIARDITRERQAETERNQLAAELAAADRRKNEFLAMLAHELRNPLAPLTNALELWKRSKNAEQLKSARETMERQLGQLVRLVDDLLDMNRITHDRLELRKAPVEIGGVIRQAVESSRPLLDARAHAFTVTLPDEPCYLHADGARLAQVFGNLLGNAAKYTSLGGKISLTARRDGHEIVVSVKDNGVGILPEKLESVFEMFTQVESALDQTHGGLGIGLALVKRFVGMHGGTVEAHSAGLGQGSEFVVRLPAENDASRIGVPLSPTQAPVAAQPVGSRRVLIVDDNADAAVSLCMLLQLEGHEAVTAHDGAEALEAVERHRPEVVLLDIGLPRVNGYEVCRRLRERPGGEDLTLIALTGWGQDEDRRKSEEAGFDGHLVKPVEYAALAALLQSLATARRAAR